MEYYENKSKAYKFVLEELEKTTPKRLILHKLMLNFGIGERFFDKICQEMIALKKEIEENSQKVDKK